MTIDAGDDVTVNGANSVGTLQATVTGTGALSYTNAADLTIGGTGINMNDGDVVVTTSPGDITVSSAIDTSTNNGNVTLDSAGLLGLAATITAGTGAIDLTAGSTTNQTGGELVAASLSLNITGSR